MLDHLVDQISQNDRKAEELHWTGGYALTIVTHVISKTQFQGISVPRSDAEAMVRDFEGFIDLLNRHSIIGAHRAIVNFATDLLIALQENSRITVHQSVRRKLQQRRMRPLELAEQFKRIGEPLHEDPTILIRLRILGEMRNLIEHNSGKATQEYVRLLGVPNISTGDQIIITGKDVGEAFALVNSTVTSLNKRVVKRFNL